MPSRRSMMLVQPVAAVLSGVTVVVVMSASRGAPPDSGLRPVQTQGNHLEDRTWGLIDHAKQRSTEMTPGDGENLAAKAGAMDDAFIVAVDDLADGGTDAVRAEMVRTLAASSTLLVNMSATVDAPFSGHLLTLAERWIVLAEHVVDGSATRAPLPDLPAPGQEPAAPSPSAPSPDVAPSVDPTDPAMLPPVDPTSLPSDLPIDELIDDVVGQLDDDVAGQLDDPLDTVNELLHGGPLG